MADKKKVSAKKAAIQVPSRAKQADAGSGSHHEGAIDAGRRTQGEDAARHAS
jgi:hypothetical protein